MVLNLFAVSTAISLITFISPRRSRDTPIVLRGTDLSAVSNAGFLRRAGTKFGGGGGNRTRVRNAYFAFAQTITTLFIAQVPSQVKSVNIPVITGVFP